MTNRAKHINTIRFSTSRFRRNRATAQSRISKLHRRFSRRSFVGIAAGAAAAIATQGTGKGQTARPTEQRTLYFDFSYLPDPTLPILAVIADKKYPLTQVSHASLAARFRMNSHSLLQALPPGTATHMLENLTLPADALQSGYFIMNPNYTTGEWSMLPMFVNVPSASVAAAFRRMRAGMPDWQPLPLSNRRRKHRLTATSTLADFLADQDLVDASSHVAALTSFHPDILSLDPPTHAYVAAQHINANPDAATLQDAIEQLGPAMPALVEGQDNSIGWATLQPLRDENGVQMKRSDGLNHYSPIPSPIYKQYADAAQASTRANVKNDESLGLDTTSVDASTPASAFQGKLWQRRDAVTYVDQTITQSMRLRALGDSSPVFNIAPTQAMNTGDGAEVHVANTGTSVTVTLKNWYLRWLVVHLQFYDEGGTLLTKDKVPGFEDSHWSNYNAVLVGVCSPAWFIMGIPVKDSPGNFSYTFDFPQAARTARLLAGGFGTGGEPSDRELTSGGEGLTGVFQFAIPLVTIAAGLPPLEELGATFVRAVGLPTLVALLNVGGTELAGGNAAVTAERAAARAAVPASVGLLGSVLRYLATEAAEYLPEAVAANVPVIGWILRGINAAATAAEIGITTYDVANSPAVYSWDVQGTQDITITIKPDPNDSVLPQSASRYELNATFGDSVPHQVSRTVSSLGETVQEVFQAVPVGGKVTYNIGFYQPSGFLVGSGSTGAIDNVQGDPPPIVITENKVPIASNTTYVHKQKTALDVAGNHIWSVTATAPAVRANSCSGDGSLCQFHSITVRQGTAQGPGYVGYSWSGSSRNLNPCRPTNTANVGQQDQLANINIGSNPQSGYTIGSCGLQPGGTKLAYNLLGDDQSHYYLDHANRAVRRVTLNPPAFDNPNAGLAHARLNLDSDSITLHPSGRIVSVNAGNHILETGALNPIAVPDDQATRALVFSGEGTRPGRLTSPAAVTMTPKGTVLVLEQGTNRIQALDHTARPVQLFSKQPAPYFLYLDDTKGPNTVYLDITVEFDGYIYVLSTDQARQGFRLDVYHPDQSDTNPIVTTRGVNAGRIAIDYWRNLYALNLEPLTKPDGSLPDYAEPSISLWVPLVGLGESGAPRRTPRRPGQRVG